MQKDEMLKPEKPLPMQRAVGQGPGLAGTTLPGGELGAGFLTKPR